MALSTRESALNRFFVNLWYQSAPNFLSWCLYPLSQLFFFLAAKRRLKQSQQAKPFAVPVVVVGNITVGGTGKTPVIIGLANRLQTLGLNVGIVSRGYGSRAPQYPYDVQQKSTTYEAGDEALLIAQATACPVIINRDRVAAVNTLLDRYPATQLILSDDGLQHYNLYRDYEIIIVDGKRGLGNGLGLPAGPLREPARRLQEVDCVLVNGQFSETLENVLPVTAEAFDLAPLAWESVTGEKKSIPVSDAIPWQGEVKAVAAIGHPQRFFDTLTELGVRFSPIVFDDHHQFVSEDFSGLHDDTVVMTSKDAVKCCAFAGNDWWQLKVDYSPSDSLVESIKQLIKK